ncbi:MAG: haloacid dehalogenase-like hydrolase [Myxococcales bacterium]|nr:haloacid dehalogenase-like hydrolase [Myxococcales bacterium]
MNTAGFLPEVATRLDGFFMALPAGRKVATFDLDGTCVHHDTGEAVFYAMARRGLFAAHALLDSEEVWRPFSRADVSSPRAALERFAADPARLPEMAFHMIRAYQELLARAGRETAYFWAAQVLCGLTPQRVREISRETFQAELARPVGAERLSWEGASQEIANGLRPYPAMARLLARLRGAGVETWIVSASNRWTVEVFAEEHLGIGPGRVLGIAPLVAGGRITAQRDPDMPVTGGAGKVEAIDRHIGLRPLLAAGDSMGDFEMLGVATRLCLIIDRGNRELRKNVERLRAAGDGRWVVQPRFLDPPAESWS